jgi:hypothetical protein
MNGGDEPKGKQSELLAVSSRCLHASLRLWPVQESFPFRLLRLGTGVDRQFAGTRFAGGGRRDATDGCSKSPPTSGELREEGRGQDGVSTLTLKGMVEGFPSRNAYAQQNAWHSALKLPGISSFQPTNHVPAASRWPQFRHQ